MSKKYNALLEEMKTYERAEISNNKLDKNIPIIMRLDGKNFKSFTKGFDKPFDKLFRETMSKTMKALCEYIDGCVFGYTQSDEISLVLQYVNEKSTGWFNCKVQKMTSLAAGKTVFLFNKYFAQAVNKFEIDYLNDKQLFVDYVLRLESEFCDTTYTLCNGEVIHNEVEYKASLTKRKKLLKYYKKSMECGANFDCRVFNIPYERVQANIMQRQQDALRNSINSVGRTYFSSKSLLCLSTKDIIEKLSLEKNIIFEKYDTKYKIGCACFKEETIVKDLNNEEVKRHKWVIDYEMPMLDEECRYIKNILYKNIIIHKRRDLAKKTYEEVFSNIQID